jgi:RNA polymerase sigma-70 factor (ECF subfamily)
MWLTNRHTKIEEQNYYVLLHKYNPLIFSLIYNKIKNRDDVLDVFQNVIIHIWEYRSKLDSSNIESVVKKTCLQEISHFYKKTNRVLITDLPLEQSDSTVEDIILAEEKEQSIAKIEKAIEELFPPIRKTIFKMNKLEGITQEKIASYFNISKRTVEKHISQSMIYLKNKVNNY